MLSLQILISQIAGPNIMFIMIILLSIILLCKSKTKAFYVILFSSSSAMLVTFCFKQIFKIPRPANMLVFEDTYRFPSSHATMAGVVCALLIYYSYKNFKNNNFKNKIVKYLIYLFAISWLALVSYSRLYLHAHILIDVITGAMIGIATTYIIIKIFHHLHYYKK